MDVTPVSMQMIIPRAADATQVQHNLNHAAAMQQDFETMRQKEADRLRDQQVQGKENADGERIKDDPDRQKRQGGGYGAYGRRGQNGQNEPEPEKFAVDPSRGHNLDISF